MDVAIHFSRVILNDTLSIFKIVGVVHGNYDSASNKFETDFGMIYDSIEEGTNDVENYFGFHISIEELKKLYNDVAEEDLLTTYVSEYKDDIYIGYNQDEKIKLYTFKLDFKEIEENTDNKEVKEYNLKEFQNKVLSSIIAQDEAVKTTATTLFVNSTSKNPKHKSHILIAGPSGTGKTEMINIMSKELNIPCFKADATAYTKEGYVGKSVYSMLLGLIDAADGDIERAQNGILIIDEIDKKSGKDDISGQDVLNSLLKIMDRDIVEVEENSYGDVINFDTSNLTIICMGAFSEIYEEKMKKGICFNSKLESNEQLELTEEDFIKYGMTHEFMGRIGTITSTNKFTSRDLINILYNSKISPIKEEQEWFKDLGVKLRFTSQYAREIANESVKSKMGARNLKKLVKESLRYAYQDVLSDKKIKTLTLTRETVHDNKKYYIK